MSYKINDNVQYEAIRNELFNWILVLVHLQVHHLQFKGEETKAVRKVNLTTQAVSAEPGKDWSFEAE